MKEHVHHQWEQVGHSVYCVPCDVRLYQGEIPDTHADRLLLAESIDATAEAATKMFAEINEAWKRYVEAWPKRDTPEAKMAFKHAWQSALRSQRVAQKGKLQ